MTQLPTEGELKLSETLTHFGAPSFSECYRGGTYVPDLTAGAVEQQRITPTGTRSNVVTGGTVGNPEMITIGFDPEFDGGVTAQNTNVSLGSLGTTTHVDTGFYSWPTGAATPTVTGGGQASDWSYIPATNGSASDARDGSGHLQYNGSETLNVSASSIRVVINVTDISGTDPSINFFVNRENSTSSLVSTQMFSDTFVTIELGENVFEDTVVSLSAATLSTGQVLRMHIFESTTSELPFTYEVVSVEFNTGELTPTHYDFDIDTSGEHFPGSGGTADIDFTNATLSASNVNIRGGGSWRTDSFSDNVFGLSLDSPSEIASKVFTSWNSDLRSNVSVQIGNGVGNSFVESSTGSVVRVLSTSEGFTFFETNSTFGEVFRWDGGWDIIPTIYIDGTEYPTVDTTIDSFATPAAVAGDFGTVTGNFPANTNSGQLAAQHLHDQIEATYAGVTVAGPTEIVGVGGTVDIDCTNATGDGSGSLIQYLRGDWRTTNSATVVISQPATSSEIADAFFSAANISLRSDVTTTRSGDVVTITSTSNAFNFFISDSTGTSPTFSWDADWDARPIIRVDGVIYDTIDTTSNSGGTPQTSAGTFNEWQIVVDTGITDDVDDASLVITENSGSNTQPFTFMVTDGSAGGGGSTGVHSTYVLNDYSGDEVTMFTSSVASSTDSDLASVLTTSETAIDDNTETPIDFTATNDTTHLTLDAATAGYVDGLFTLTAMHGSGDGNLSFATTEQTRGVPVGTNGNIPTSGELKLTNFYGGDNGAA